LSPIDHGARNRFITSKFIGIIGRKVHFAYLFSTGMIDKASRRVRAVVIGTRATAARLADELAANDVEASPPALDRSGAEEGGIPALASALIALERELAANPPDAVVLADAGDLALAGALVATKLLIPVGAVGAGGEATNADLLRLLADRALSGDPAEIAAWVGDASAASGAAAG
jgi:hypothetical protein